MQFCRLLVFLLYSMLSWKAFGVPNAKDAIAPSKKPSPFYLQPTFFEGPLNSQEEFWERRKQRCIQEIQERWGLPDETTPDTLFVPDEDLLIAPSVQGKVTFQEYTVSVRSEQCQSTLPRDEKRISLHVLWETPQGLFVFSNFFTVTERIREGKEYKILEISLKDWIPGGLPEITIRFSMTSFDQSSDVNTLLQQETEFLFLLGMGLSQHPSAVAPLPIHIVKTQTKELPSEPGPISQHWEAHVFYHLGPQGNLLLTFPKKSFLFSRIPHPPSGVHSIDFP